MTTPTAETGPGSGRRRAGATRRRLAAALDRVRRELGALDLAVYDAVASTPSPTIDAGLARVSNAANHSRLWVVTAGVVSLFGKDSADPRWSPSPPWEPPRPSATSPSSPH